MPNVCAIDGCDANCFGHGYCARHYTRWRRYGDPLEPLHRAPNGSGTIKNGYRVLRLNGRYVQEHRLVWEQANGPIPPKAVIHHVNGDKLDNRLENLKLVASNGEHLRVEHAEKMREIGRRVGLTNRGADGKGKPKSPEHRAAISAALKGKPKSASHAGVFRKGHEYHPGRWK